MFNVITKIKGSILIARPEILTIDIALLFLAYSTLALSPMSLKFFTLLITWIAITGGTHSLNSVFDLKGDSISRKNSGLANGLISVKWGLIQAILLKIIGLMLLLSFNNISVFALGICCICLSFLYSIPPIRLKGIPLVSTITLASFYTLEYLSLHLVLGGLLDFKSLIFMLIIFLNLFVFFLCKDYRDFFADVNAGDKNLLITLGTTAYAKILSVFLVLPMFVSILFFSLNLLDLSIVVSLLLLLPLNLYLIRLISGKDSVKRGIKIHKMALLNLIMLLILFSILYYL